MRERTEPQRHVYDYRITDQGQWVCQGNPVLDSDLVCLLSRSLRQDAQGKYRVRCQGEVHPVRVEDAPLLVERLELSLDRQGCLERVELVLADGRVFGLTDTLAVSTQNKLYATPDRPGLEALFSRRAFYELTRFMDQDDQGYYIPVAGKRFHIKAREARQE